MCILLYSTEHPDYSVILSNRDEIVKRKTAKTEWRSIPSDDNVHSYEILCPADLEKAAHGTWIAVCPKTHKIAVLLNIAHSLDTCNSLEKEDNMGCFSRGDLPFKFVKSDLDFETWNKNFQNSTDIFTAYEGFSLACFSFSSPHSPTVSVVSNRKIYQNENNSHQDDKRNSNTSLCDLKTLHDDVYGISNDGPNSHWEKVKIGTSLLKDLISNATENNFTSQNIIDSCFDILSHNTLKIPKDSANKEGIENPPLYESVFIPPIRMLESFPENPDSNNSLNLNASKSRISEFTLYATRTQTVILINKHNGECVYVEKTLYKVSDGTSITPENSLNKYTFNIA